MKPFIHNCITTFPYMLIQEEALPHVIGHAFLVYNFLSYECKTISYRIQYVSFLNNICRIVLHLHIKVFPELGFFFKRSAFKI